jgi:hypothetical protein
LSFIPLQKDSGHSEFSLILEELLDYGGIICGDEKPKAYVWRVENNVHVKHEIKNLQELMDTFGPGTYQIELSNPSIEGPDPVPYKIEFFYVDISYLSGRNWGRPHIQTETEEIPPEYAADDKIILEKVKARNERLANKIEGAMTILGIFADFYHDVSYLFRRP